MEVAPITLRAARAFVTEHHRHNRAPQGGILALSAVESNAILGVAVLGRPVARGLDDGVTAELIRVCVRTDAPRNTGSFLYARAWRICVALGYQRMISYTLQSESGESLRGAGLRIASKLGGRKDKAPWGSARRCRAAQPIYGEPKLLWERVV